MSGDAHMRDPNVVFPFPIPVRDRDTWGVTYAPVMGNTLKRFLTMDEACDYHVGVQSRMLNLGLPIEAPKRTLEGWADQDKLIAEWAYEAKRQADETMRFSEYLTRRRAVMSRTFEDMLDGVCK